MNGFTKLLPPMDGWKCDFCGVLTHYPDEHTEKCRPRRAAEIDRLKAEVERLSALADSRLQAASVAEEKVERLRTSLARAIMERDAQIAEIVRMKGE